MIRRVVVAAHGAGKPVGVCGEMAARPELAAALIALGVDSLSVAPPAIPELKQAFSNFCLKPLTARAAEVLAGRDAHETERTIRQHLRPARD
jgi:phosphoenolpyruvate-protein kinase (PTS system EI component)